MSCASCGAWLEICHASACKNEEHDPSDFYVPDYFRGPDVLGRENHGYIGRGLRLRHLVAGPLLRLADVRSFAVTRTGES
jgi:hypothetical protein